MPAKYLLRFDDICPGMNWPVWRSVEVILGDAGIRPLLAVVPDNRDPVLNVCDPEPRFWDKVRGWQECGWAIGLHGFQHRYTTQSAGILGRNRYSEFAGLPESDQKLKIESGVKIFREQDIRPCAWIAPAHSFDGTTIRLLAEFGIDCISDGYSLFPFLDRGMFWVPQQLGRFLSMPLGTWTVCMHINSWTDADLDQFSLDVARFRDRIVSLDELRREYRARPRQTSDKLFFACCRAARSVKGFGRPAACPAAGTGSCTSSF